MSEDKLQLDLCWSRWTADNRDADREIRKALRPVQRFGAADFHVTISIQGYDL